ncbi:MAG: electron transport complex subunit E [Oscillospiraceae bacterium]|nr:electron transport complex subunit E [Oscillospiraceae bacterium]
MSEHMSDKTYKSPDQRLEEKKKSESPIRVVLNGLLYENPAFRLILGMCPLLAVTISAKSSFFMGLAVIFVLTGSEFIISLLRHIIPDKVRIPAFITIIAGFVTIVQLVISAYMPALNESLGIYIPLIVVNCIVLARAETFASKKSPLFSVLDGLSMGGGFMIAMLFMGSIREILGSGTFFDFDLPIFGSVILGQRIDPMMFFTLPPGGFFVLGICIVIMQFVVRGINSRNAKKNKSPLPEKVASDSACESCGACSACNGSEVK